MAPSRTAEVRTVEVRSSRPPIYFSIPTSAVLKYKPYLASRKTGSMSDKKLFLLDGHALIYRAHYAFINRPLINSKGLNTSAITGFTRTLWDLMRNEKPTHIAVAFDPPSPIFRHEMYEEYKANREEQPEDIALAIPYIKAIVEAFNIPIVMVANYEADDVIGTLAKQAEKEGFTVYMVTPDKDYAQLVSENIYMYKPSRQGNGVDIWGVQDILEKWQVERVDQVIDVLGLQGDSIDNIPGIPGIGAKMFILSAFVAKAMLSSSAVILFSLSPLLG